MPQVFRTVFVLVVALGLACTRERLGLPPLGEPVPADWAGYRTADSALAFSLPPGYGKRNDHGCYQRNGERWPGAGWRDVCIHLAAPGTEDALSLQPTDCGSASALSFDCMIYDEYIADTVVFDGRRAIVERALASGGIEHLPRAHRRPHVLIRLPVGATATAILVGRSAEPGASQEFVAIARTIRLTPRE